MDSRDSKKNSASSKLVDFDGKIETKQVPFFNFIRITIIISVFLALYMILL
ncbi:MAG: hypothetical protein O6940_08330 [Ignavibacteria bacterium]|nr:hypothetical protein [Ignavibacteria bacterium]